MQTLKLDEMYRSMQGYRTLPDFALHPEALAWYDTLETFVNTNWRARQKREEHLSQTIEKAVADRACEEEKARSLGRPLDAEVLKTNADRIHEMIQRQREQNFFDTEKEVQFVRAAHKYVIQEINLIDLLKLTPK